MANRALVIACGTYDDERFAPLPAAPADAAALAAVLGDPGIGDFDVQTLVDATQREALRALESFFTRAKSGDLLLLHLSLHGWKDLRGRLHFVMRDTELDYLRATAISADLVGDWMSNSLSRRIVVLLDCCYSGAFTLGALRRDAGTPKVDVAEPFHGNGRVVLTASTALQYAYEGEQNVRHSRGPTQPAVFTSAVVSGLSDGSADLDGDGLISVEELYDYVHEQVRRRMADQTPTLSVDSAQGTIYLARSPRHPDVDRLTELRGAARDAQAWKRIGSLHLVEHLLGSVREPTRDAARDVLLGLIADADREVARRARQLWHERGLGDIPAARPPRPVPTPRPRITGSGPVVGIDFGTTNSAIAVYEGEDIRLIPNAEGSLTTPSLVAITDTGEIVVGTPAKRQVIANPHYTIRSAKLKLGTDWSISRGSVRLTADDVAEHILRRLREDAEAYLGGPLRGAVLTVPADFDRAQRAALVEAADRAGIRAFRVINEPTAAAVTYGLSREEEARVLVFDLGGGTLDVSVIEVGDGIVEVLASGGDSRLGGDDWDRRIVQHVARRVWDRYGVDLLQDALAHQRLVEAAEAAKVELSSASATTLSLPYIASVGNTPLHVEETLSRQEFEAMTRDLLERCRRPVEQALAHAELRHSDLSQIILTGGATRMPMIGTLVSSMMNGRLPYRGLIPEGIVTGASLQGGVLTGAVKEVLLLDVTPTAIAVAYADGTAETVMERNLTIPNVRHAYVTPGASNPTALVVHLVEGEEASASANSTLAVLELTGLRPGCVVEVGLDIDPNGVLHVGLRELREGHTPDDVFLARTRAGQAPDEAQRRLLLDEVGATHFTDRRSATTVTRSTIAEATTLVRSPRWPALRELAPLPWQPPEPPPSVNPPARL